MDGPHGLDLGQAFYAEAVRPVLDAACPGLVHSAARVGRGSEVLGFDDAVSRDHDWGPRLELFLDPTDRDRHGETLTRALAGALPRTFGGHSTSFGFDDDGVGILVDVGDEELVRHRVEITTLDDWFGTMLGFDPRAEVSWFDWLATSSHRLAEVTGGRVFHDGLAELEPARASLAWYPTDVWRFVLASQWHRIAQEEAFVGRCAQTGDDLGSALVAARLVRDLMRLSLSLSQTYLPYSKWLGAAFRRLPIAAELGPLLADAVHASSIEARDTALGAAYTVVAEEQNRVALCEAVDPAIRPFWKRGFPVIFGDRFAHALQHAIGDAEIAALPLVGSVDQFVDSTDVLAVPDRARAAARGVLGPAS